MRVLAVAGTVVSTVVGAAGAFLVVGRLTPRPTVKLVRWAFERGNRATAAGLRPLVPSGITADLGVRYRADALLDVYRPDDRTGALPVVIWAHGGGWVSGGRSDLAPYLQILAARGFVTVAVDYGLPPTSSYPTPVHQLADALAYVSRHAERWGVDRDRMVLAGDSAGAQLASQVAALVTNPQLAAAMDRPAPVDPAQLRGVVLACGTYRLHVGDGAPRAIAWVAERVAWAYWGAADHRRDPRVEQMDTGLQATADFPRTLLTVGNIDPLRHESERLAARLVELGVETETLFYPPTHEPPLNHEYQFDLSNDDGRASLDRIAAFVDDCTAGVVPADSQGSASRPTEG
ncbi:acetyl esterase/lipase [Nakamurella flavida]|nr:acetyl esterase/lipase [Nakamurella flavida]